VLGGATEVSRGQNLTAAEIYTRELRIVCRMDKGRLRVSDLFNQADRSHVEAHDAIITSLQDGKELARVDVCQVAVHTVVVVIPREAAGTARSTTQAERQLVLVTKYRHAVTMHVPPFVVAGHIHLPSERRAEDSLLAIGAQFIPLTEVTLTHYKSPNHRLITAEAALVNRSCVDVQYFSPSPTVSKAESRLLIRRFE